MQQVITSVHCLNFKVKNSNATKYETGLGAVQTHLLISENKAQIRQQTCQTKEKYVDTATVALSYCAQLISMKKREGSQFLLGCV